VSVFFICAAGTLSTKSRKFSCVKGRCGKAQRGGDCTPCAFVHFHSTYFSRGQNVVLFFLEKTPLGQQILGKDIKDCEKHSHFISRTQHRCRGMLLCGKKWRFRKFDGQRRTARWAKIHERLCERSFGTNMRVLAINATTFSRRPNLLKRTSTKML